MRNVENSMKYLLTFLAFVLLKVAPAQAEEVRKYVFCRNGKTVRTIRVEKDRRDNTGWVTLYTKAGKDQIVGEGFNPVSCEGILERVQKTLESYSWKCRDVSTVHQIHRGTAGLN